MGLAFWVIDTVDPVYVWIHHDVGCTARPHDAYNLHSISRSHTKMRNRLILPSIDSVERLTLVRQVNKWREPMNLCNFAAQYGHLEVLQWARLNGCPWDELTCILAANNGHLDVLQWARLNGCPG